MMRRALSVSFGVLLVGCGPQVEIEGEDPGSTTGFDTNDGGCPTGTCLDPGSTDDGATPQPTATTPDPEPEPEPGSGSTTSVDVDETTTTTSPPSDDDADDADGDSCWTGGGGDECCAKNPNFCTGEDFEPDIEGSFLVVFSLAFDPQLPLQYLADIAVTDFDGAFAQVTLSLQPLSLDVGSTTVPREPVGDPIVLTTEIWVEDLEIGLGIGSLFAAGATNPISGSDIVMDDVMLTGVVESQDSICGTIDGAVTSPLMLSLESSTFAMIRVENPTALPETFPLGCI